MSIQKLTIGLIVAKMRFFCYYAREGPIVYRLGHILLKDGSGVRFPVGSQIETSSVERENAPRAAGARRSA